MNEAWLPIGIMKLLTASIKLRPILLAYGPAVILNARLLFDYLQYIIHISYSIKEGRNRDNIICSHCIWIHNGNKLRLIVSIETYTSSARSN